MQTHIAGIKADAWVFFGPLGIAVGYKKIF